MTKVIILMSTVLVITACSYDGKFRKGTFTSTACGNTEMEGYTMTAVRYGDSGIIVLPLSDLRPNTEFRILLSPKIRDTDEEDYHAVRVTVTGKQLKSTDRVSTWIGGSSTFNDANKAGNKNLKKGSFVVGCVPSRSNYDDVFRYAVVVGNVGTIDPRAKVVR